MRLPKRGMLIFNMLLCAAFAYVSISSYSNGAMIWWLWGLISILYGFTTITLFVKGVKEGWSSTEIVEDERTWNVRLVSCFIAYIYVLLILAVGIFAFYTGNLSIDPVIYMALAVSSSLAVFVMAQIGQFIQE